MKAQHIFYILGIIFLFATVTYFTHKYLYSIATSVKIVLLALLVVMFFYLAEWMKEKGW